MRAHQRRPWKDMGMMGVAWAKVIPMQLSKNATLTHKSRNKKKRKIRAYHRKPWNVMGMIGVAWTKMNPKLEEKKRWISIAKKSQKIWWQTLACAKPAWPRPPDERATSTPSTQEGAEKSINRKTCWCAIPTAGASSSSREGEVKRRSKSSIELRGYKQLIYCYDLVMSKRPGQLQCMLE